MGRGFLKEHQSVKSTSDWGPTHLSVQELI